ncbi:MAG: hypothetical protein ACON38_15845 [Akkermansiaceae bacterium]
MKRLLLTLLFVPLAVSAQNQRKYVRFIPLGELPPWKEELIDGVRVQQEAPPGAIVPKSIAIPDGEDDVRRVDLNLRQPTKLMAFSEGTTALRLYKGEQATGTPWLSSPMPTSKHSYGILFRDNANMTWDSPKLMMLRDDAQALPAGSIRFVNVSDHKTIIKVGKKSEVIQPGKSLVKELKEGANPILAGYYEKDGRVVMIFQNTVRLLKGQRVQAFFFKGQGVKPRTGVKFLSFPEPMPRP